jgi:hypothetical protein
MSVLHSTWVSRGPVVGVNTKLVSAEMISMSSHVTSAKLYCFRLKKQLSLEEMCSLLQHTVTHDELQQIERGREIPLALSSFLKSLVEH